MDQQRAMRGISGGVVCHHARKRRKVREVQLIRVSLTRVGLKKESTKGTSFGEEFLGNHEQPHTRTHPERGRGAYQEPLDGKIVKGEVGESFQNPVRKGTSPNRTLDFTAEK